MSDIYSERRKNLYQRLTNQCVAIVPAQRKTAAHFMQGFQQSADFFYLTALNEPEAVAVFTPGKDAPYTLFIRPNDPMAERYDGPRLSRQEALSIYGANEVFLLSELPIQLPRLLEGFSQVSYVMGDDSVVEMQVLQTLSQLRKRDRKGMIYPTQVIDLREILHEQRLIKDEAALAAMRKAAKISVDAHLEVMRSVQPGQFEYELEAQLAYEFRRKNATIAYQSIVAAGKNSTVLHYTDSQSQLVGGELLLIDAACQWQHMASDITRTYPIPQTPKTRAKFSSVQREIYDIVLAAQKAGIKLAKPGVSIEDIHQKISEVIVEGLVRINFLQGNVQELIDQRANEQYQLHLSSHFIGLDVHDVGRYQPQGKPRLLEPGMAFTIEPGLYILPNSPCPSEYWNIGIRIEDDIVITTTGNENLTEALPKEIDELEALVGSHHWK